MQKQVYVHKYNGRREPFSPRKLQHALRRAGADDATADRITNQIAEQVYDGISTREIYAEAFDLLRNSGSGHAARFHLKRAIMELGPSGYPFEQFIGALFAQQGFQVQVGVQVQGKCVAHEVDVVAEKDDQHYMVECKYHNALGNASDVKVALYVHARFLDIEHQWSRQPGHGIKFHQGWLVTNTRLTSDALQYGNCAGLRLLSWDYPEKEGLKDLIDRNGLYPITCLTTLASAEKEELLSRRVVLCHELCAQPEELRHIGVPEARIPDILREGAQLCAVKLAPPHASGA